MYLDNLCAFKNFSAGVWSNFLGEEETEVSNGKGLVQGHTATYQHFGVSSQASVLATSSQFPLCSIIFILLFPSYNHITVFKIMQNQFALFEKNKIKTPCQLNSCTWPLQSRLVARTCRKAASLGSPQTCGAGGMLGAPQLANTWGGLLVITRKLGGTDGFGKHFCRVLLTEKKERESGIC